MSQVQVEDHPGRQRFEAYVGDELAGFAAYELVPGLVVSLRAPAAGRAERAQRGGERSERAA